MIFNHEKEENMFNEQKHLGGVTSLTNETCLVDGRSQMDSSPFERRLTGN
jgi:hypothetical protein